MQNSLIGGEVTPLSRGRTDVRQYTNSLDTMQNQIPLVSGGAKRRPGSSYFNTIGSSGSQLNLVNAKQRMIPWELTNGKRLMLCIGGSATSCIVNLATNALETVATVFTYTTAEAQQAQYIQIGDILIITCPTKAPSFFGPDSSGLSTYFQYTTYVLKILLLFNTGGGSPANVDLYTWTPYLPINTGTITIASSGTTGAVTLTASAALFNAGHVGTAFKLNSGAVYITGFTSSTSVAGVVYAALTTGTATTAWQEGSWSDYRGWPRTVAYYQNRLVFGGTAKQPDTLFFSEDSNVFKFSTTIGATEVDTDPFDATPSVAEKISLINWITGGKNFAFGTAREEFVGDLADPSLGFSATNFEIKKQTSRGSSYIQAVRIEAALYFVDSAGQRIVEFVFDLRENSYRNRDINIFADHVFAKFQENFSTPRSQPIILNMCGQSEGDQKLWVLDNAGGLFSCVVDRIYDMNAWSIHYLGGNGAGGSTNPAPFITTIAPINNNGFTPSTNTGYDILWMITNRTLNSATPFQLEYLDRSSDSENDYLDCKTLVTQSSSVSVTGLTNLKNESVSVVADGLYVGEKTVSNSGVITLATAATSILVGFKYQSKIKTLPVEAGSVIGSAIGSIGRIDQARVHFNRSMNASVGSFDQDAVGDLDEIVFRSASLASSTPTPAFTGFKRVDVAEDYEREQAIVIATSDPFGMTVTHLTLRGVTSD